MKIFNVRFGLATNSSSSHSIVVVPKNKRIPNAVPPNSYYGWDNFTLTTLESKADYLSCLLYAQLRDRVDADVASTIVSSLTGVDCFDMDDWGGVDHQSVFQFPVDSLGNLNQEFARDFAEYIKRDGIVILGGNDNSDGHPLRREFVNLPTVTSHFDGDWRYSNMEECIAQKAGDYWILFNKRTGTKMRLSFDSQLDAPTKANQPELVDVKITDYCPYGCDFCYQASTHRGKHVDLAVIKKAATKLRAAGVMEVALGGGEPTLHPQFLEVLEAFAYNGILPNFTTKNLKWLADSHLREKVIELCGSFAYSVQKPHEVDKLAAACDVKVERDDPWGGKDIYHAWPKSDYIYDLKKPRPYIHVIPEIIPRSDFIAILKKAEKHDFRVTLLGYKNTGFGAAFSMSGAVKESASWVESVARLAAENKCPVVGIDTQLAAKSEQKMRDDLRVDPILYTKYEGAFSMYLDLVECKAGPSSFCDVDEYVKFDIDTLDIEKIFKDF